MKKRVACLVFGVVLCTVASEPDPAWSAGGDIRLRTVHFERIPLSSGTTSRGGVNHFQRYRFRLWAGYELSEQAQLYGRLANEFRTYVSPSTGPWKAPDEVVIDNLYLDWSAGDWSLRVGRQDLIYGTGKLILDGTPKDGSRTLYFDAVKATYHGLDKTEIDFFAMYTRAKDPLAINSQNRDIVGFAGNNAYKGAEAGGGVYLKSSRFEALPFELYTLVKTREQHDAPAVPITNTRTVPGFRIMPVFSETLDANLEVAGQFGTRISAYMVDSALNWHPPALEEIRGTLSAGWYHLSGNREGTGRDEGWNPLWARWPQYSEMYVYAYDTDGAGRWSNISMPHAGVRVHPLDKLRTDLMLGWMMAPEKTGPGGGRNRGMLATLWNRFTLRENWLAQNDRLFGHVLLEVLEPGNYYRAEQRHTAFFARLELSYSF